MLIENLIDFNPGQAKKAFFSSFSGQAKPLDRVFGLLAAANSKYDAD